MKKSFTSLFLAVLFAANGWAQYVSNTQNPTGGAFNSPTTMDGSEWLIGSNSNVAGTYFSLNTTAGIWYKFHSTNANDIITVTDQSNNVLIYSKSPCFYLSTSATTVRVHTFGAGGATNGSRQRKMNVFYNLECGVAASRTIPAGQGIMNYAVYRNPSVSYNLFGNEHAYVFAPSVTGTHSFSITNPTGNLDFIIVNGTNGSNSYVGYSAVDGTYTTASLTAGQKYLIFVDTWCSNQNTCQASNYKLSMCGADCRPPNVICANATTLPCETVNLAGTTVCAMVQSAPVTTNSSAYGVWYTFVGDGKPTTISSTAAAGFNHEIGVYSGSCGSLSHVATTDAAGAGGTETYTFTPTNNTTYFIYIAYNNPNGTAFETGTFTISRTCCTTPPNDLCANAALLQCGTENLAGSTACATAKGAPMTTNSSPYGVWYTFVGDGRQTTISSTAAAGFNHEIGVYTGACGSLSHVATTDAAAAGGTETYTFTTTNGAAYYIYIAHNATGGTSANTGAFTISRSCPPCVSVTVEDKEVCENDSVHLIFTGTAPFILDYTFNDIRQTITVYGMDTLLAATQAGVNMFIVNDLVDNDGCTIYGNKKDIDDVIFGDVIWATRNVNAPNTFTLNPEDYGMFYQFDVNLGWSSTGSLVNSNGGTTWNGTTYHNSTGWEPQNNPCPSGWRVPTMSELNYLFYNTNSIWTTQNGVNGRWFGDAPNQIFLPAVGYIVRSTKVITNQGTTGYYWSSTNVNIYNSQIELMNFNNNSLNGTNGFSGLEGLPVRCVKDILQKDIIIVNSCCTVAPTVTVADKDICDTESVHLVFTGAAPFILDYTFNDIRQTITVNDMEKDLAVTNAGEYIFIMHSLTDDNGCSAEGGVEIDNLVWATRNVDMPNTFAETSESMGMYYQWNRNIGWHNAYLVNSNGGTVWDSSTPTGTEWEAGNNPCPSGWRVPSQSEYQSLIDAGSSWTTQNSVNGRLFGVAPNQIFLPAMNYRNNNSGARMNIFGYWSSTQYSGNNAYVYRQTTSASSAANNMSKVSGFPVRCVTDNIHRDTINVESCGCAAPTAFGVTAISDIHASLTWASPTAAEFMLEYGASGFTPGTDSGIDSLLVQDVEYYINGLSPLTAYDAYIRAICGEDNESEWVQITFTTLCEEVIVVTPTNPYLEDCESSSGSSNVLVGSLSCWTIETDFVGIFAQVMEVDNQYTIRIDGNYLYVSWGQTDWDNLSLISPVYDITELTAPVLTFDHFQNEYNSLSEWLLVYYSVDGEEWIPLDNMTFTKPITWQTDTSFLPDGLTTFQLKFEIISQGALGVGIDNIRIFDAAYTVTLDAGTGDCGNESIQEESYGAGVLLPSSQSCGAGWGFVGWATSHVSTTTTAPDFVDTHYQPTDNITLYAVYSKNGSYCTSPACTTTGIDDVNAVKAVLYPNPAKHTATLVVEGLNSSAQVVVTDLMGRAIASYRLSASQTHLDINVNEFADGTYFVRILSEKTTSIHKMVVKK